MAITTAYPSFSSCYRRINSIWKRSRESYRCLLPVSHFLRRHSGCSRDLWKQWIINKCMALDKRPSMHSGVMTTPSFSSVTSASSFLPLTGTARFAKNLLSIVLPGGFLDRILRWQILLIYLFTAFRRK